MGEDALTEEEVFAELVDKVEVFQQGINNDPRYKSFGFELSCSIAIPD